MFISWLLTIIAIVGAVLNSQAKKESFYFWIVSNTGFCIYNACINEVAMSMLFGVYLIIALNGIRSWK